MRRLDYKWIALLNATLAVLLATLDGSITIIAMPDIFRGIHLDPLVPANSFYLLWMILGYLVVTSVLIVSLGRLGDMVGRVRIFNLGFVIYTVASLLLAVDWLHGRGGATYLIVFRIVQGIGGACLLANAAAIITDAFPSHQRGMALGINNIVGVSGTFIGLVLGGILAPVDWRLVFLISVPVGIFGTVWAYRNLRELSTPRPAPIDWPGNVTFALGLVLVMVAVTYGIRPAGGHPTGWASPRVLLLLAGALVSLTAFVVIELRSAHPMFRLSLFRIRAFTFGTLSTFLSSIARGGLMFMLIIWLQGIWLPRHGYSFTETPLWAGIYMLPLTAGLLGAGPVSGYLSDRFGARPFATAGMLLTAAGFGLLLLLPTDFSYVSFSADPAADRGLDGPVRLAQPRRGDEQPARRRPRGRWGDEPDLPELRPGALDRRLLHADDRRARREPAGHDERRPGGARGVGRRRAGRRGAAAGVDPVRRLPRLQPDRAPARPARAGRRVGPRPRRADRAHVLPHLDLWAVPRRPPRRVPVRDRRVPDRGGRLADARRSPRTRRSSMRIEWYGQSAFRLSDGGATVFVDPFDDMTPMAGRRRWDYPAIAGVEADLLLVTHEHLDHNGVGAIGGDPATLRSTAGRLESPLGEVLAVASEHDEAAAPSAAPTRCSPSRSAGAGSRTSATSGSARCAPSSEPRSAPSTSCSSRSAAGRPSARGRRPRSPPSWARA